MCFNLDQESVDTPYDVYLKEWRKLFLLRTLNHVLTKREAYLIYKRFGLVSDEDHTLRVSGELLNVGVERARQIEAKALRKLRKHFGLSVFPKKELRSLTELGFENLKQKHFLREYLTEKEKKGLT